MAAIAEPGPSTKFIGQKELVCLIAFTMSLNALAIDGMLPALDDIALDLGAEGNRRQLVVGIYLLAGGIGCLFPGAYADRFGRRPLMLFSLAAYCIFSLSMSFVQDFSVLLGLRALQGMTSAGLMVVPMAIIRDRYEGDQMARLMSLIGAVFITVPILAPSLGQLVLLVAGWRWIFVTLAIAASLAAVWIYLRLPETLTADNRQNIQLPTILRNMRASLLNRASVGYVVGTAFLMGGVFGYVNSAQQLLGEHFGAGEWFPLVFGATAAMMIISNIVNSTIVERFGARPVSHIGVLVFIAAAAAQVWASHYHSGNLWLFLPIMAVNMAMLGFLGANFGAIAMQPFGQIAGAASSVHTFFRMFFAAIVGIMIGQAYDGTAQPFAHALLLTSMIALLLVLYSEKGELFKRRTQRLPRTRA